MARDQRELSDKLRQRGFKAATGQLRHLLLSMENENAGHINQWGMFTDSSSKNWSLEWNQEQGTID